MKDISKLILFLLIGPLLGILLASGLVYYKMNIWKTTTPIVFEIHPGQNFSEINGSLAKSKIISTPRLFHRLSQYKNTMTKFRSGKYLIPENSNMFQVHNILLYSKSLSELVTIPEGKNMFEIALILEKKGLTTYAEFIATARDKNFLNSLGLNAESVEGYLYPNTYDFTGSTTAKAIIEKMVQEFQKQMKSLNFDSSKLSFNEVHTLASIVEKETGHGAERKKVAGVFFNRLRDKMRLQSDPTTIYGIYERYKGNLTKADLQEKTPYNTYAINGIPKGPISNPGLLSFEAVLNPETHGYYYFVSMNDGTHVFSESYEKHLKAVEIWQKNAKNRQGRSWRDLNKEKN